MTVMLEDWRNAALLVTDMERRSKNDGGDFDGKRSRKTQAYILIEGTTLRQKGTSKKSRCFP